MQLLPRSLTVAVFLAGGFSSASSFAQPSSANQGTQCLIMAKARIGFSVQKVQMNGPLAFFFPSWPSRYGQPADMYQLVYSDDSKFVALAQNGRDMIELVRQTHDHPAAYELRLGQRILPHFKLSVRHSHFVACVHPI